MSTLQEALDRIRPVVIDPDGSIQHRLDLKTKPRGSLGRLEELAKVYTSIRGKAVPVARKVIFTFAGDHGVAAEGVSAFPQEVTGQMVLNFLSGGAGINVLAKHVGARVVVADLGVASELPDAEGLVSRRVMNGTSNMAQGPAMTREQAVANIQAGIDIFEGELAAGGIDICATGEMGIANTTPSSAIVSVLTGRDPDDVTGRGTGIDDEARVHKVDVIRLAIDVNKPDPADAIDVLAKVGGCEIGGLAGVCLAAAAHRVPVVIDGFISTAAACIAAALKPEVTGCLIAAHKSVEPGHTAMLDYLGKRPLLDLDFRLGEGTGAALAMSLVEAGVRILNEMASFEDAGVSTAD